MKGVMRYFLLILIVVTMSVTAYVINAVMLVQPAFADTYITTEDNEDNNGTGVPDEDMGSNSGGNCVYNDDPEHPIEFNINVTGPLPTQTAYLSLLIRDVDFPDEMDEVYLNGHKLGYMIGADDLDISTLFIIPDISWVKSGNNLVQIYVDILNDGWCAETIGGQLIIDEPTGNGPAYLRYLRADATRYDYGDNVTIDLELDTTGSQNLRLELVLRDPNGNPIYFDDRAIARSWAIQDTQDEPYQWSFTLPSSGTDGIWEVTLAVYDVDTFKFNLLSNVSFLVPSNINVDPIINGVTPQAGPPGQAISINGTNFTSDTVCTVGGINLENLNVVNNTTITATIPTSMSPGTYDITCSHNFGTGTLTNAFTVTGEAVAPVDTPTINEWGILIFSLFAITFATIYSRRRIE